MTQHSKPETASLRETIAAEMYELLNGRPQKASPLPTVEQLARAIYSDDPEEWDDGESKDIYFRAAHRVCDLLRSQEAKESK